MCNIDEIYNIEKNCFADAWTKEMLESELSGALSLITVEIRDGKTVGFALGRAVADEGELFKIAVLPEYRRRGIAEKLLLELHEKMREKGAARCFLEVRLRNEPAAALYEKLGYRKMRVIPQYYPDDDALAMEIVL